VTALEWRRTSTALQRLEPTRASKRAVSSRLEFFPGALAHQRHVDRRPSGLLNIDRHLKWDISADCCIAGNDMQRTLNQHSLTKNPSAINMPDKFRRRQHFLWHLLLDCKTIRKT
jgi:hypothetical protein